MSTRKNLYSQYFLTEIEATKNKAAKKIEKLRRKTVKNPITDADVDLNIKITKEISKIEMGAASSEFNPNNHITDSLGIIHFAFPNPGLQCYANSLLQMLLYMPEFKQRVLSIPDSELEGEDPHGHKSFARNIRDLLRRLDDIQVPERFTAEIQTEIRERLLAFSPLDQGEQQDLMELFQGHIDINPLLMPVVNEFSVSFNGTMTSNILVHVHDPERLNLKTYVEGVFSEQLDGDYTLPDDNRVLMLYLPRAYNPDRVGEDVDPDLAAAIALSLADKSKSKKVEEVVLGRKNMVRVNMAENITIGGKTYELVSFTEHLGENVNSGHYVCWCKIDGNWVIFNDGRMPGVDIPELEANTDVTLFAYRLVEPAAVAAQEVLLEPAAVAQGVLLEPAAAVARSHKPSRVSAKIKAAINTDAQLAQDIKLAESLNRKEIRKTRKLQEEMVKSGKLAASLHRKEQRKTMKLKDENLAQEVADEEFAKLMQEEYDAETAKWLSTGGSGRRKTMRKKDKNKSKRRK